VYGVGPPRVGLRDVVDVHNICVDSVDVPGVDVNENYFP
jgi:hypothetical protein